MKLKYALLFSRKYTNDVFCGLICALRLNQSFATKDGSKNIQKDTNKNNTLAAAETETMKLLER